MQKVILVHGFWHGSWCWSLVTMQLAKLGIESAAVDLDGHGLQSRSPRSRWGRPFDAAAFATEPSGMAQVTASSAARTLVGQLAVIGGGEPCVVVAHSMGGVVATAAAELAPELFAHLVYVSAYAPVSGQPAATYIGSPEDEGSMIPGLLAADPLVIDALRIDTGDPGRHAAIREALYGDVDEGTAAAAVGLLAVDAPLGIAAEAVAVTRDRYGAIPCSYVTCTQDKTIPIALQRRFITEIGAVAQAPTAVTELDSSHSPFLSQPAALAAAIADACAPGQSGSRLPRSAA